LNSVAFRANCQTTAMGIMPHRDLQRAMKQVLALDIPFWPQLPHLSYYEDMYAQFSQHFPGICLDLENKKLSFDNAKFERELPEYSLRMSDPAIFALSAQYSRVYRDFLAQDLGRYSAIRGQIIGPVSFGFRVADENDRPIIYNDDVRTLLFDFLQNKINLQYRELKEKNPRAFVWLDEPGLSWVFSGFSGYSDLQAVKDYRTFFAGLEGPPALHLCANVNLPYLLELGAELLSFDAFQIELMPKGYADSIAAFFKRGGTLCWGIVPTDSDNLAVQTPAKLTERLVGYWEVVAGNSDIAVGQIARQSLIAPARCCLKNIGQVGASDDARGTKACPAPSRSLEEELVEQAFDYLAKISADLRARFDLAA
jgi:hypothetical protein